MTMMVRLAPHSGYERVNTDRADRYGALRMVPKHIHLDYFWIYYPSFWMYFYSLLVQFCFFLSSLYVFGHSLTMSAASFWTKA